eukprot:scaffold70705_cov21-Tisochrysis_lutea.AAC.1
MVASLSASVQMRAVPADNMITEAAGVRNQKPSHTQHSSNSTLETIPSTSSHLHSARKHGVGAAGLSVQPRLPSVPVFRAVPHQEAPLGQCIRARKIKLKVNAGV